MPSSIMDQRHLSPFALHSDASSFFSDELHLPTEWQVGFWKHDSVPNHHGTEGVPFPFNKLHMLRANSTSMESYNVKDQKNIFSLEHRIIGPEMARVSATTVRAVDRDAKFQSTLLAHPSSAFVEETRMTLNDNGLFSSSLSDIFNKKLILPSSKIPLGQSVGMVDSTFEEDEPFESMEEIEAQTIGNLLPNDDDLLSGVIDDIACVNRPKDGDDIDDDIFYTVGGMELEADDNIIGKRTSELFVGGASNGQHRDLNGLFAGEHPFVEHPSRTLFVRNINSNVEDAELRLLFEQYGDICTLYTACKHRGFVMISYYDIRSARNAMRALQNKPLRRRKLDIHFSIPKDNPSEKDINQGTLVVFNLDSSVSNEDLHHIFGVYGEIKEIRETPHKHHRKFIEFYDVRAADAAVRALNGSDIAGKKIKLEPSRPGGAKRCLMQQSSLELEHEELNGCGQGSPNNSLLSFFGSAPVRVITSNGFENGAIKSLNSAARVPMSGFPETTLPGISSSVSQNLSSPVRITSAGNHNSQVIHGDLSYSPSQINWRYQNIPSFHPHSLPEYHDGLNNGTSITASAMSHVGINVNSVPAEGIDNRQLHKIGSGSLNCNSFNHNGGAYGASELSGHGSFPLHAHQYFWTSSNTLHHHPSGSVLLSNSPTLLNNVPSHPRPQMHGVPRAPSHMLNTVLPLHHHVGSAPTVNPSLWDRRLPYAGDSLDQSAFHPGSLGSMGFPSSAHFHPLELASRNVFPHIGGNRMDPSISPAHVGMSSPQQRIFHGRNPIIPMPGSFDGPSDRMRSRRNDSSANLADNKKQYELDIERIVHGEDPRTTLMIKNIPNKYTSKMLLVAIDENHKGTYDFIYLPIDFKNKCNVGYAFINMIDPEHIVPFYQSFNGKKWEKFNSEKVASLAYARIQGKAALIAHFQNSSLMNEDKRCRPILFHSGGPNAGDQEPFPIGSNTRSRSGRSRAASGSEENNQGSPSTSANEDGSDDAADFSKDLE